MKKVFFRQFTLILGLVLPMMALFAQEAESWPPILEYYPDCSYQIVKTFSAKKQTRQRHSQEPQDWLLKRLRREAQALGADAYAKLGPDQEVSWQRLSARLGESLGSITLSVDLWLNIYNHQLLVTIKDLELTSLSFVEQLRAYFPDDAFELADEVGITADKYNLSLLFSELYGEPASYEAQMRLY
ncbi:hypothetical protein [Thalassomonas haliotis]|uniref:Uncharacterized protein n=1 Tax=Thalassomonas haliotis TaxID=485448 RepID=A0ABY7VGJ9_9GAMM|nr:hypothetical protein [Thalassomonas haliotis]WDE12161.1 hypothetical protein H3N35_01345 [Thalassomonas haliotis]